ncbi:MAG: DUF2267 domain-containing protein [Proteobacteria bacterium]|nr:DUF2267 domain-containing protein [Pseudomonadota bacterium]
MMSGLTVFDSTIQETNGWLNDIQTLLINADRRQAYEAVRAVLHTLRDRLTAESAVHLSAQLPMLLRGLYFEGWKPSHTPTDERSAEAFIDAVAKRLPAGFAGSVEDAVRAVFEIAWARLGEGEAQKIMRQLPRPILELWPAVLWAT